MNIVDGGFYSIQLRDGTSGNHDIAKKYYEFLSYISSNHSGHFNQVCQSVFADSKDSLQQCKDIADTVSDEYKKAVELSRSGKLLSKAQMECVDFAWRNYDPEQILEAVQLCAEPTRLSSLFKAVCGTHPLSFKLAEPFQKGARPSLVIYEWMGHGDCPYERSIRI